jgi:hypothetical protein
MEWPSFFLYSLLMLHKVLNICIICMQLACSHGSIIEGLVRGKHISSSIIIALLSAIAICKTLSFLFLLAEMRLFRFTKINLPVSI